MEDIKNRLSELCGQKGILLTEKQLAQFQRYMELLVEWNQKMNLTAITDPEGVTVKHFYDSLILLQAVEIPEGARLIDVGTGAGFPGIPLAIARPDIRLTLLDSLNKRLTFLAEVCRELGIQAELRHARAEEGGRQKELREQFDVATARAVAGMNVLSEYCLPFVKKGGVFAAMKGPDGEEEVKAAARGIGVLGGKPEKLEKFELPDGSRRCIAVIRKVRETPAAYPRHGAKIAKKPL